MGKRPPLLAKCACLFAFALGGAGHEAADSGSEAPMHPPKIIFETDFTADVDDVGALTVLHALADRGEADILAVSYNEGCSPTPRRPSAP